MVFHFKKEQVKKHCAYAVYWQPGTVEKSAVAECPVFPEENDDFPEIAADGGNKIKEKHQGYKVGNIVLLRWAELSKIRLRLISFHGNSITIRKETMPKQDFLMNLTKYATENKNAL